MSWHWQRPTDRLPVTVVVVFKFEAHSHQLAVFESELSIIWHAKHPSVVRAIVNMYMASRLAKDMIDVSSPPSPGPSKSYGEGVVSATVTLMLTLEEVQPTEIVRATADAVLFCERTVFNAIASS